MIASTSEPNLETEPGFNLASIVVAERNSKAAITEANKVVAALAEVLKRVELLERKIVVLEQTINTLKFQNIPMGTGPTSTG